MRGNAGGMLRYGMFLVLLMLSQSPAAAEDIHIDPNAETGGDGSAKRPFASIEKVLAGKPGQSARLVLASGFYGDLVLREVQGLTVQGADGDAVFSSVVIADSSDVVLRALTVDWARRQPQAGDGESSRNSAVRVDRSRGITIDGLTIRSAEDGSRWSAEAWRARAASGITAQGQDLVIRNNRLFYIRHGIQLTGSHGVIEGNTVAHFSGDGLRAIGDFNTVQDNSVHSCYAVDKNHDDGFQSWSLGPDGRPGAGVSRGTVLRRNTFLGDVKPGHPLQCRLQGIGLFGDIYEDWVIENNLVVVDHWHGITVMGARRVVIRNNTVFDPADNRVGPAGVRILPHKDGRQPEGSLIANNLAPRKSKAWPKGFPPVRGGVEYLGNVFYGNPRNVFRDPEALDLRPHAKSFGTDYAKGDGPKDDLTGYPRPWGKRADVGAYEYRGDGQ